MIERVDAGRRQLLTAATALWARFHLAAVPGGKELVLTWYQTVGGRRIKLRASSRNPTTTIRDSMGARGRHGTITAVLSRARRVISQTSVRLR